MRRRGSKSGGVRIDYKLLGIIEEISLNMDVTNIDAVTERLRVLYKGQDFGRQKYAAQQQMVERVVRYMIKQGTVDAPQKPTIDLDNSEQINIDFDEQAGWDEVKNSNSRPTMNQRITQMYGNGNTNKNQNQDSHNDDSDKQQPQIQVSIQKTELLPQSTSQQKQQYQQQQQKVKQQQSQQNQQQQQQLQNTKYSGKRGRANSSEKIPKKSKKSQNSSNTRENSPNFDKIIRDNQRSSSIKPPNPTTYSDLGGIEEILSDIKKLIEYPLKYPEVYFELGIEPTRGVLLHGPPGCGKTALANAIANECGVPFLRISAPEVVSGMSGESEAKIRSVFKEAAEAAPCIVFIDEIDAICPKREVAQREMEKRIVAQILLCMDQLPTVKRSVGAEIEDEGEEEMGLGNESKHVVVLGATNRPDSLDTALRRAGRFDREIKLGIPTEEARIRILQVITKNLKLDGEFYFKEIARKTPGYVGADLVALCTEAGNVATARIFDQLEQVDKDQKQVQSKTKISNQEKLKVKGNSDCYDEDMEMADDEDISFTHNQNSTSTNKEQQVLSGENNVGQIIGEDGRVTQEALQQMALRMEDFSEAIERVQPSVKREGFTTSPTVSWEDVGALRDVRDELSFTIAKPILKPERFQALGLTKASGVLLFGPPGCGKTLVAQAVANESGANFISIKGPELLNKYVGESERAVRQVFERAGAAKPCVLFFDEMDALAPKRGTESNLAAERVVNQLLAEMDGVTGRTGVYVIAATNRPDMIDSALLRPGRLDKILFVPLPSEQGRLDILDTLTKNRPLGLDVDLKSISQQEKCQGMTGADLANLVTEACMSAIKENWTLDESEIRNDVICMRHFVHALVRMTASVSKKDARRYDELKNRLHCFRAHVDDDDYEKAKIR